MGVSQVSALPGGWGEEPESLLPCTQEAHPRSAQGASVPRHFQLPPPQPRHRRWDFWQPEAAQDTDPGAGCGNERTPEATGKRSKDVGRAQPESF